MSKTVFEALDLSKHCQTFIFRQNLDKFWNLNIYECPLECLTDVLETVFKVSNGTNHCETFTFRQNFKTCKLNVTSKIV